jgi:hypothetical protein
LNEYGGGAFEALSWVRRLIRKENTFQEIRDQVDVALHRMREGVAVEFGEKIRYMSDD